MYIKNNIYIYIFTSTVYCAHVAAAMFFDFNVRSCLSMSLHSLTNLTPK